MLAALLPILNGVISKVAGNLFPDPADELRRQEMEKQFTLGVLKEAGAIELAAADIVKTEAASAHWLAANWRPVLMLTFGALIVARWFGWAAPNLSEAEYLALWNIVELGLGGYVIGRSAEKIAPMIAGALKSK